MKNHIYSRKKYVTFLTFLSLLPLPPPQGVLRMIYAFYAGIKLEDAPHQELKLNHVTAMTPLAYGCEVEVINLLSAERAADDGQKHH